MIQPQCFLGSGERDLQMFYHISAWRPSCSMNAEQFEHIINTLTTEDPMWNLVKFAHDVSEKKTKIKNSAFLYMYIAQGAKADNLRRQKFDCN